MKVVTLQLTTQLQYKSFSSRQSLSSGMRESFMCMSPSVLQNIRKMCTRSLRFNKGNIFLSETGFFPLGVCGSEEHNDHQYQFDARALILAKEVVGLPAIVFAPSL